MNIINIKNLNYSYKNKEIFKDLNLTIKEGTFLFIVGPNGSGKTTLIKILLGLIKGDFDIQISNENIKDISKIRKQIGVVFENPLHTFMGETVYEEIVFGLENLKISKKEIEKKVQAVAKELEIENLLTYNPTSLSGGEQQLVSLAAAIVIEPKLLIIDESLSMLDGLTKNKLLKKLKSINRTKKITILCVTQDTEDTLYGKEIAILNQQKIVLHKKIKEAFLEEQIFKTNNLKIPFMAELSMKLQYYDLVDEIILDMDKMVNKLWK